MRNYLRFIVVLYLILSVIPLPLSADVTMRGFQVDYHTVTADKIAELATEWGVNLVRLQVGNEGEMDGTTGAEYTAMMEEEFDLLDQVLPLFEANGIKIVFALYSPPGGFETRTSPSHYMMFSDASLQQDFINLWVSMIQRYGSNPNIYAFDLANEPAMRPSLLGSGAKTWNKLLLDAIAAIREVNPSVTLMVKSLYGDPSKLQSLPAIDDENVIYSFHPYFYERYQHAGIYNYPLSTARPTYKQLKSKYLGLLSRFLYKSKLRHKKGEIPSFPPRINAGEVAVSACADEAGEFMDDMLSLVERDDLSSAAQAKKKKKKSSKKKTTSKPVIKRPWLKYVKNIELESWTVHSYDVFASPWDPTTVCLGADNFEKTDQTTDRETAIKSYLSRN